MYLLDANVFITAKDTYYPFDFAPGLWTWLALALAAGTVGSIREVHAEITTGAPTDPLTLWVTSIDGLDLTPDDGVVASMREIAAWTTEHELYLDAAKFEFLDSADYVLIAHGLAHGHEIVTQERSEPNRRNRVKIPDVCHAFGVEVVTTFEMLRRESVRFVMA